MPGLSATELRRVATRIRLHATRMVSIQGFGYLGQALSSAEILAVLFAGVMRHGVDRFVMSPGHYVIALYAAAVEAGLLDADALSSYGRDGSRLEAIGTERTPVADLVCGSLGQGLSGAIGFALAAHLAGQIWEAAMFASHYKLGNLTLFVDTNGLQIDGRTCDVMSVEPIDKRFEAFGWHTVRIDGHDFEQIRTAVLAAEQAADKPSVIVCNTIKGRGVSFMEDKATWHGAAPSQEEYEKAMSELCEVK
jgi:transketolase